jgi:hypothetical protein
MSQAPTVPAANVPALLESNRKVILLDVRTPAEFGSIHATGARNIPLDSIQTTAITGSSALPKDATLCILCEKGGRATIAAGHFLAAGYPSVHVVEGGTQAWVAAGLPVVKVRKSAICIERQVRIGAGILVLIGVILGLLVNQAFFGLPAFIGAGLVFAGITNWCGMGLLLAKAPWNR